MKKSPYIAVAIFALFGLLALGAGKALANPTAVSTGVMLSAATTTPNVLTPGTGTTTITYDSYVGSNSGGFDFLANRASLLAQFQGSSTLAVLKVTYEYSQDGIDWYSDYVMDSSYYGTTTQIRSYNQSNAFNWQFASTTVQQGAITAANSKIDKGIFQIVTPIRYVRAVVSVTGANAMFWGMIVPSKEIK